MLRREDDYILQVQNLEILIKLTLDPSVITDTSKLAFGKKKKKKKKKKIGRWNFTRGST